MSELFKDQEEQKKKGPVFNVTNSQNSEIQEELENRRRRQEEQRKWMENDPNRIQRSKTYQGSQRLLPDEETAKKELKKDYFKITEPVVKWEDGNFPQMSDELKNLLKDILNDNKRMTKSHFGVLKGAVQDLAKANSDELKEYFTNRLIIAASDYLDASTEKTSERRKRNCEKLIPMLRDYKRAMLTEQERIEKANAGNDKDVKEIIRYKEALESIKSNKITPYPGADNPADLKKYNEEISGMGMLFAMRYNMYISACDTYLSKKNKSQKGQVYIRSIKEKAERELKIFNNTLTEFLSENRTRKDITWGEALEHRVNKGIELDTKSAENKGGDTSNVYKLKRGTSSFAYFKQEEKLPKNITECWDSVIGKYKKAKLSEKAARAVQSLDEGLKKDLANIAKISDPLKRDAMKQNLYNDFCVSFIRNRNFYKNMANPANESMEELVNEKDYHCWNNIRVLGDTEPELVNLINNVMKDFVKKYNSLEIATNAAGIKAGSNLSGRNVATYRMGVALGIESSVARSETAEIKVNGRAVFGNLMDEASGKEAFKACRKGIRYSGKAACDMAMMHIFDLICGQVDRNDANYFVDSDENTIRTVMMIDNDMAFGMLDENAVEKGKNVLPGFSKHAIAALPETVKRRIKDLDKKTLEVLLEDILSAEEITAADKRLKFIQKQIRTYENESTNRKKSDDKKVRYEEYCMKFDEYRGLKYQYEMLTLAGKEYKRGGLQNTMNKISYLKVDNMPDENTLLDEMDKFMKAHEKDNWDAQK